MGCGRRWHHPKRWGGGETAGGVSCAAQMEAHRETMQPISLPTSLPTAACVGGFKLTGSNWGWLGGNSEDGENGICWPFLVACTQCLRSHCEQPFSRPLHLKIK